MNHALFQNQKPKNGSRAGLTAAAAAAAVGLILISRQNYLLFHSLAELFSILISGMIFIIAWNGRDYIKNPYLLLIGIAYLFVGFLDLFHTLSYKGMAIFTDYDYYANQFWVIARALEAGTLLAGFYLLRRFRERPFPLGKVFTVYLLLTGAGLWSVLGAKNFPVCFVEGRGQTPFKLAAEGVIIALLLLSLVMLYRRRSVFRPSITRLMAFSISLTILGELGFTFYISNYGLSNLAGHLFKLGSFYLIYRALIQTGFRQPMELIFRELREQKEAQEEANRSKDQFFSIISHDLRSPLSGLIGITSTMKDQFNSIDPEDKELMLKEMHSTARRIYSLLENLLEWSRLQTNRIQLSPQKISLEELSREAAELFQAQARQKEIRLSRDIPGELTVQADPKTLSTALRNLLSNSLKFTPPGGTIHLTGFTRGDQSVLEITDTGVGIPPEVQDKIFRLDNLHSTPGTGGEKGSGLGLILTRQFVEKNGGTLEMDSRPGRGSTFRILLPPGRADQFS